MIQTGIIRKESFAGLQGMPQVFEGHWQPVERGGKSYLAITAFRHYFTDAVVSELEAVLSEEEYQAWLGNDMVYLDRSWAQDFLDYKQARERLKQMVLELGGFDTLTPEEQRIAAHWFVLTDEQIDSVLTLEERLSAGIAFDAGSVDSRVARFAAAKSFLYNVLEKADGDNVVGAIVQSNFEFMYTKLGQEGTMKVNYKGEADRPGVFDFVLGTDAGVVAFGYRMLDLITTPKYGFTPQQVVDKCMDILDNGNY